MKRMALPVLSALAVVGCRPVENPLERFYYPVKKLENKDVVYAYQPIGGDSSKLEFWHFYAWQRGGGRALGSVFYRPDFSKGQWVIEAVEENGTVATQVDLFENDPALGKEIQIGASIHEGNVFPFEKLDTTEALRFSLDWHPPKDTTSTIYLKRTRRFLGDGPAFLWRGKNLQTVRFALREVVGNQKEGSSEVEGRGVEVYADGLGLVYYKKDFDGGLHLAYKLVDTFGFKDLERRAGRKLNK